MQFVVAVHADGIGTAELVMLELRLGEDSGNRKPSSGVGVGWRWIGIVVLGGR